MNYSNIIDDMTWSYSRIGSYQNCPYQFLQHYIYDEKENPKFFSDYGSFMHEIIAERLKEGTPSDDLIIKYLGEFRKKVLGEAPNAKIFEGYLDRGAEYIGNLEDELKGLVPLAIEERYTFDLGGRRFVGIVDMVARNKDGELCLVDHKSHQLKARSHRDPPTKADEELDQYLRQLYIYSIPVKEKFGEYPKWLIFNCFRNDWTERVIKEPFVMEGFEAAKKWALDSIEQIRQEEEWEADVEFWKCSHICGLNDRCEAWLERRGD